MRTVLILEEDGVVARAIARIMREAGWSVLQATSAQQAFTLGRLFSIDLLIADVILSEGTGVQAARRLVADRPGLHTLFVSEFSDWRLRRLLPAAGRCPFLQTPFTSTALLDSVASLIPEPLVLAHTA